jgi:hypothetical protein
LHARFQFLIKVTKTAWQAIVEQSVYKEQQEKYQRQERKQNSAGVHLHATLVQRGFFEEF